MKHPYENLAPDQYWSSGMSEQAPGLLCPTRPTATQHLIRDTKVATLGSCFAQHIGRALQSHGFCFYQTETAPDWMSADYAREQQYGVYSARYGNVYTPRQAVQLFTRAFGQFVPLASVWSTEDGSGSVVDPFRPNVQPGGFKSEAGLLKDRERHLAAVRQMFMSTDWLVLTLGLTEGWQDLRDGAIYPLAPGVAGGQWVAEHHKFVNFTVDECIADLRLFQQLLALVNPAVRIILTVSPVALAATYEPTHVWAATTYSKSVLRVAAETLTRETKNVTYFPAYEIITSPLNASQYLANDLRQVNAAGVAHVMRAFFETYAPIETVPPTVDSLMHDMGVVCDESLLDPVGSNPALSQPLPTTPPQGFDEASYLATNPDVAAALARGHFKSAQHHYEQYGRFEGRKLSATD